MKVMMCTTKTLKSASIMPLTACIEILYIWQLLLIGMVSPNLKYVLSSNKT